MRKEGRWRVAAELRIEMRGWHRIWKEYFEDIYNVDAQEQVALMGFGKLTILEEGTGKLRNWKFQTAKIDCNISYLT